MAAQAYQKKEESWGRYDFLGIAKYITAGSIVLVIISLGIIFAKGLNYGVDFAGGIEVQAQFNKTVDATHVRKFMADLGYPHANVQSLGDQNEYLIHVELVEGKGEAETNKYIQETIGKLKAGLNERFANEGAVIRQVSTVGPQVGKELRRNGILAAFYCLLLILIFVGLRFDYRYAPGAVFCLFHDAIITVGLYSLFNWEFTTQTMAAVLTIIGYSLNDTIVIFDRIRENQHLHRDKDIYWVSNRSINETLSRTILTYMITYMTVASMFFFADGVIRDFAIAMMIGMFLGAYSTVYVATPLMLMLDKYQKWKKHQLQTA
ncbi:MAG: protein translocase subunit SecF [Bdellovibrionales bacterium]